MTRPYYEDIGLDYRELRLLRAAPALLNAAYAALPFAEDALDDPTYKEGYVQKQLDLILAAIEAAEEQP